MKIKSSLVLAFMGFFSFLSANPTHNENIKWTKIFDVKSINAKYIPQAIEVYDDYVLFSVHAEDTKSALIVFKKHKEHLEYLFEVDMPREATHTSDFNVLGETLYAIDYASEKIYQIDIPTLINERRLLIDEGFDLEMGRTGSLVIINVEGEAYVLVSQFILSNKLKAFKLSHLKSGEKLKSSDVAFEIESHRFIQGLYAKYEMLLMATNNFGIDTISIIDITKMIQTKSTSDATLKTINAPFKMVEDITIYGNTILTSDEESNFIYESQDLTK